MQPTTPATPILSVSRQGGSRGCGNSIGDEHFGIAVHVDLADTLITDVGLEHLK